MKCINCDSEIGEQEATTYLLLDNLGLIKDYASVLCKNCLKEKKNEKTR